MAYYRKFKRRGFRSRGKHYRTYKVSRGGIRL